MILLDTNILLRSIEANHIHQRPALDALKTLGLDQAQSIFISPQVLIEFYAVATRASNTLNLTADQALAEMESIRKRFQLVPESPEIFPQWEFLVRKYKPTNRRVFDARHVAFMLVRGITRILTFNDQDFVQYSEIQVLNPFDVLKIPRQ